MEFETTVTDILKRTRNVKSFRFLRPASFTYQAGQFMFVTIESGKGKLRKHFTISTSPTEKGFIEFTKKLSDSEYSAALNALKVGDWAKIEGPYGLFTLEGEPEKVGMLSGGIGITPLRSMCKYCTDMNLRTHITVLCACHAAEDIVFREDFEEMKKQNKNMKVAFTVDEAADDWTGYVGRIDAQLLQREIPDYRERVFYTCGPPAMVKAMEDLLRGLKVPQDSIKKENFTGY